MTKQYLKVLAEHKIETHVITAGTNMYFLFPCTRHAYGCHGSHWQPFAPDALYCPLHTFFPQERKKDNLQ